MCTVYKLSGFECYVWQHKTKCNYPCSFVIASSFFSSVSLQQGLENSYKWKKELIKHRKILKDNRNPQNHWDLEDESSSNGTMTYNICVCWSGPVKVQTSIQFSICGITLVWKCYEQFSCKQVEDNKIPDKYTNIELWTRLLIEPLQNIRFSVLSVFFASCVMSLCSQRVIVLLWIKHAFLGFITFSIDASLGFYALYISWCRKV